MFHEEYIDLHKLRLKLFCRSFISKRNHKKDYLCIDADYRIHISQTAAA